VLRVEVVNREPSAEGIDDGKDRHGLSIGKRRPDLRLELLLGQLTRLVRHRLLFALCPAPCAYPFPAALKLASDLLGLDAERLERPHGSSEPVAEKSGEDVLRLEATPPVAVAALNDLLAAARELGGVELAPVEGPNADQFRRAVRSATAEVLTGKDDRLLRRLAFDVDLGVQGSEQLRQILGSLAGAHVDFELTVTNPNQPVQVEAPANAVPYSG